MVIPLDHTKYKAIEVYYGMYLTGIDFYRK